MGTKLGPNWDQTGTKMGPKWHSLGLRSGPAPIRHGPAPGIQKVPQVCNRPQKWPLTPKCQHRTDPRDSVYEADTSKVLPQGEPPSIRMGQAQWYAEKGQE